MKRLMLCKKLKVIIKKRLIRYRLKTIGTLDEQALQHVYNEIQKIGEDAFCGCLLMNNLFIPSNIQFLGEIGNPNFKYFQKNDLIKDKPIQKYFYL